MIFFNGIETDIEESILNVDCKPCGMWKSEQTYELFLGDTESPNSDVEGWW